MAEEDAFERVLQALSARDWSAEAARHERVGPLLHRAIGGTAHRGDYVACAARNVELFDGLDEIAQALFDAGVRPVLLKGGDLATRLYPTMALRPMSDLDLWVSPEEIAPAESALASLGLAAFCPEMTPGLSRRIRHARLYVRGKSALAVDLHWSLVGHANDRRAPSLAWFESRAVASEAGPWRVLDETASLLYLAAHAKLQHWDERAPLVWLVDFYLASHQNVDWDALLAAAERFAWNDALAAIALETKERLGLVLPGPLERFVDATPRALAPVPPTFRGGPERALKELSDLDWWGRGTLVFSYLFPSRDYLRFRYRARARWPWPLLYLARWASLVASGVSLATRRRRSVRS